MGAPQYEQAGADIGGTGTTNTIPRWTGPSTLGDSGLIDDGSVIYTTARNAAFGSTSSAGYRARVLAAAGTGSAFGVRIDAGTNSTDYALRIANQATTSDYFVVRGDGFVGIGTAAPGALLDVNTGTAAGSYVTSTRLSQTGTAANSGQRILFYNSAQAWDQGAIGSLREGANNNFALTFFTSASGTNAERARIDSAGRLLVGTSTAPATTGARAAFAHNANLYLSLNNTTSNTGVLIGVEGTKGIFYTSTGAIGSESYVIASTYDTTGIQLGTTTAMVFNASGSQQGLKLPATPGNTDPNTLDCYADGGTVNSGGVTWTPTLNFGGATTGITYAANGQVGRYTRVGNMVYLTMYIKLSSKGSATGNATITGLPTSANVSGLHASGAVGIIANITFANQMTAALLANSAELRLYETTNAGLVTTITDADFAANSELAISIAYPVN